MNNLTCQFCGEKRRGGHQDLCPDCRQLARQLRRFGKPLSTTRQTFLLGLLSGDLRMRDLRRLISSID